MPLEMKEWTDRLFGGPAICSVERLQEIKEFCGPDSATLLRIAEVFENSPAMLAPYPEESINQAFWDLGDVAFRALADDAIDWSLRERVVNSFVTLFREYFAVRCQPVLGHLDEEGTPLNSACYMWWDFNCWLDSDSTPTSVLLPPIRSVLTIDHVACQESALHGLGHLRGRRQSLEVEGIIDDFLQHERNLRAELREYANQARAGRVL